jgi:hypothetical protein
MSIKNLEFTGLKDQNIVCKNLTVLGDGEFENLSANNFTLPDPLIVNDLNVDGNLEIGTLTNNNTLNLNISNQFYNEEAEINIKNNISSSLKIVDDDNTEYLNFDTSTGGKKIQIDTNINIINNRILNSTGEILVGSANLPNASSYIVKNSGFHQWASGVASGVNPLQMNSLNDEEAPYILITKFNINSTANTNYLSLRFNNNSDVQYSYRVSVEGGVNTTSTNDTEGVLVRINDNSSHSGASQSIIGRSNLINTYIDMYTNYLSNEGTPANAPNISNCAVFYQNVLTQSLSS